MIIFQCIAVCTDYFEQFSYSRIFVQIWKILGVIAVFCILSVKDCTAMAEGCRCSRIGSVILQGMVIA